MSNIAACSVNSIPPTETSKQIEEPASPQTTWLGRTIEVIKEALVKFGKLICDLFHRCIAFFERVLLLDPSAPPPNAVKVRDRAGMTNLGNSCYLNAVIQALFHVGAMSQYVRQSHGPLANDITPSLMDKMRECFNHLESAKHSPNPFQPSPHAEVIRRTLIHDYHWHPDMQQHDAHEVTLCLIDALGITAFPYRICNYHEHQGNQENDPIDNKQDEASIIDLGMPHQGHPTLLSKVILEGEDREERFDTASGTEKEVHILRTHQLVENKCPEMLILALRRYNFDRITAQTAKNTTQIEPDQVIDMPIHQSDHRARYRLKASVLHQGNLSNRGHYTTSVPEPDGGWTCFNDAAVYRHKDPKLAKDDVAANGYLHFYEFEEIVNR